MSRYIDADALKAFIRNKYFQCDMPEEWGNGVMWATSQINRYCNKVAPSIDIVRCKECKYAHMTYGGDCKYCDMWKDDDGNCLELYLDGDYYCADGEREGE